MNGDASASASKRNITVEQVLAGDTENLTGIAFRCTCGQTHEVAIRAMLLEDGALSRTYDLIERLKLGRKAMMLADVASYAAAGRELAAKLRERGMNVAESVYPERQLYADEKALAKALLDLEPDADMVIAVGSGTINDIARMISYKTRIPYLVVATAPSMDGYASTVSPLLVNGFKVTYGAVSPVAVVGDLKVIRQAPREMFAAGLGDMLAKLTALCDWKLAAAVEDEPYCDVVAGLMLKALRRCVDLARGSETDGEQAAKTLMEGLVLSGIAMQMIGNSRPASGSEHHLSHYWEMKHFAAGKKTQLHGIKVGVATPVVLALYGKLLEADIAVLPMREKTPGQIVDWERHIRRCYGPLAEEMIRTNRALLPDQAGLDARHARLAARWEELKRELRAILDIAPDAKHLLRQAGGPVEPEQIGIGRDELKDALLVAKEVRNRYTILQLADQLGLLERYADELASESR